MDARWGWVPRLVLVLRLEHDVELPTVGWMTSQPCQPACTEPSKRSAHVPGARGGHWASHFGMASAAVPSADMTKKTRVMSDEEVAAGRLRAEAYAQGSEVKPEDVSAPSTSELKYGMGAFPGVQWANNFTWTFGSLRTICVSAWIVFLLLPTLFFTLVRHILSSHALLRAY